MTDGIWMIDGNSVYLLQESGQYRKGQPVLENKFLITIQGQASDTEKTELAKNLYNLLSEQERNRILDELTAESQELGLY